MMYSMSKLTAIIRVGLRFSSTEASKYRLRDLRNIGIIAHIDAGKTTVSESMLYHAGKIRRMGKVDSGNTVTDYLPSERARGITVQSAVVSFPWRNHLINLIDTPGHVDFTIEVERALHVLDSAVAVIDGSRGVEAQTRMVWRQADKLKVPRIAFVNKMDKTGADFYSSVASIENSLSAETLILQHPLIKEGTFQGVINLVDLTVSLCQEKLVSVSDYNDSEVLQHCVSLRQKLVEKLADFDDEIADLYLSSYSDNILKFPSESVKKALSRALLDHQAVPVLCGSAYKDIGVTTLLNAITDFLPSPEHSNLLQSKKSRERLVAYVFKVLHHKRLGPVIFARVVSGRITSGSQIYNASVSEKEKVGQVYTVFADEYMPVSEALEGYIVALTGLKYTKTGHTLHSRNNANAEILAPVTIPNPVFFCTVECDSPTEVKALEKALIIITREDPSIQVKKGAISSQIMLCGMGELHLDILVERLKKEFSLNCHISPIQVAYKEKVSSKFKQSLEYQRKILDKNYVLRMTLSIAPINESTETIVKMKNVTISPEISKAIKVGILQSCDCGPLMGFPLIGSEVKVHNFEMASDSPATIITAAAVNMTNEFLKQVNCSVLEPVMNIEITTNEEKLQSVLDSLSHKRATVMSISGEMNDQHVVASAPVSEMLNFASYLRKMSSGNADLTLTVAGYEAVPDESIESLRDQLIGFS